ncbi:hypothetical protein DF160_22910 [Burkholderia anthina]|nr:hypothetical protein DF160_22910 [Burkholderia anthina]
MANKAVGTTRTAGCHAGRPRSSCRSQPQMIHAADRGVLRRGRCSGSRLRTGWAAYVDGPTGRVRGE